MNLRSVISLVVMLSESNVLSSNFSSKSPGSLVLAPSFLRRKCLDLENEGTGLDDVKIPYSSDGLESSQTRLALNQLQAKTSLAQCKF